MEFPHLYWHSEELGIRADALVSIFAIEREFHARLLLTESAAERQRQYRELYNEVHRLRQEGATREAVECTDGTRTKLALTFRREIEGKSMLDVGCGEGTFLREVARLVRHGKLCGIDTSEVCIGRNIESTQRQKDPIEFLLRDVIDFELPDRFDVVFSHQVLEHIAPADLPAHIRSVHAALKPAGKFIVILPNRFWGPQDITRIVDNTFTGRVPAMGSHVNESSYTELTPWLKLHGFTNIKTIWPLATHIPFLRSVRVRPVINGMLERNAMLRSLSNLVRWHGRPVFKNSIVLICERRS
jgi:2-polyprenyl-3-methyl-5-hydroxy-6-metoxy-1,4-benzoquinol methylase